MTKRQTLAVFIALVTCVILLGMSSMKQLDPTIKEEPQMYSNKITKSEKGLYCLFKTNSQKEYVDFLENISLKMYYIIDITIELDSNQQKDCFMITYKKDVQ